MQDDLCLWYLVPITHLQLHELFLRVKHNRCKLNLVLLSSVMFVLLNTLCLF